MKASGTAGIPTTKEAAAFAIGYHTFKKEEADKASGAAAAPDAAPADHWATPFWWTKWKGAQPELSLQEKVDKCMKVIMGGEINKDVNELKVWSPCTHTLLLHQCVV